MKQWLSICIIIAFVTACSNNQNEIETIHVNPHEAREYMNLSEIADSIRLIRLQTDSGDVMGRVKEIIVKKKYIYVFDVSQQCVFVFDKSGKLAAKLTKQGNGFGEYSFISSIFIDDDESYIEVVDNRGKSTIKRKYKNLTFEQVEETPFPALSYNSAKRKGGKYYFAPQQIDNVVNQEKTNPGLIIMDENRKLTKLFDKKITTDNNYYFSNIECFTLNDRDELFVSMMYDNTFYQLNDTIARPILKVDFGEYGIDNSVGNRSTVEQMEYLKSETPYLASFPVLNVNNSNILSFTYSFKETDEKRPYNGFIDMRHYIQLKPSQKVFHAKDIRNDLSNFPEKVNLFTYAFVCSHEIWHEDYLVDICIPSYYFRNKKEEFVEIDGVGKITPYDNPIVILMKLKQQ